MKLLSCPVSYFLHNKKTDSSCMLLRYATKMVIRDCHDLTIFTIGKCLYDANFSGYLYLTSENPTSHQISS
jgi:hypothetical protein